MAAFDYNTMLPVEKLKTLAEREADNYQGALPFAHGCFDGIFDDAVLDAIIEEFEQSDRDWHEFSSKYEKKFQMNRDANLRPVTRAFIHNLNSEPFLQFLETLTGVKNLIPDPYLVGGGLHKIPRGGRLGVHVDFNKHQKMNVFRRLNVLIYLNRDWQEEYGGYFELWDEHRQSAQVKLLPIFNRMAIFTTTATSFHGHPEPLTCPEDRHRISLALYYYTANDRGDQKAAAHSTVFLTRDGRREELGKPTLWQRTKGTVKRVISPQRQA
ncbi:2OG-Fe(II) oxygenase [Mangrovimicrobium sediminis]|uniref:2OG-Fe(II) oxygenase n=1 Tax=Mangrovimicrobium sediminis TaxID=2562682 RepID=A0A4Z0M6U3_9GAMM|nr:2OG-Fe(II) oxygenase [Haliea sp. SAOS-164]TGD75107.1 2OG-Fe(II) oxygenase [Haliea sp. SAOS-164]